MTSSRLILHCSLYPMGLSHLKIIIIMQFFPCECKWRPCEVKWALLVLIIQTWIWPKVFIAFCNFLLNDSTSLLTHDDSCKTKWWGTHITVTFVFNVCLANSERILESSLASFLATSLVPPQIITTSFFVRFSSSRLIELMTAWRSHQALWFSNITWTS
jgi:hypothetical protein